MSGWKAGEQMDRRQTNHGLEETLASDPTHLCVEQVWTLSEKGNGSLGLACKETQGASVPKLIWKVPLRLPKRLAGTDIRTPQPGDSNDEGLSKARIKEPLAVPGPALVSLGRPESEHTGRLQGNV